MYTKGLRRTELFLVVGLAVGCMLLLLPSSASADYLHSEEQLRNYPQDAVVSEWLSPGHFASREEIASRMDIYSSFGASANFAWYSEETTISVDDNLDTEWALRTPVVVNGHNYSRYYRGFWFTKLKYIFKPGENIQLHVFRVGDTFIDRVCGNHTDHLIDPTPPNQAPVAVARDQRAEQDRAAGAPVLLDGSASYDPDGQIVSCRWRGAVNVDSNGSQSTVILPLGRHEVTLTVVDNRGASHSANAVLTVVDTTPPNLTVPADIRVEQATAAGTRVPFSASASDICDAAPEIRYSATPGTIFPLGSTRVNVTATDDSGNTTTKSFNVIVMDTTAPDLTVSDDITVEQATAAGTKVDFDASAVDICDASPEVVAVPASGTVFPLGTTPVSVTATDDSGNTTEKSFNVTVEDTTPPVLTLPEPITVEQETSGGTVVKFEVTAEDICDATPEVVSVPPSGTEFPLGITTVTCTATDDSGNVSTETFDVTVEDTTPPNLRVSVSQSTLWSPNHDLMDVGLAVSVSDICDNAPDLTISVTQDEPVEDQTGDGRFSPDAKLIPNANGGLGSLLLRGERKGDGDGRVYLIIITATDDSGNVSQSFATVTVTKSQSKADKAAVAAQAAAALATGCPLAYDSFGGEAIGPKQ
ncbi:MAG: HYR domain-containing protein [Armatimonadota bacterium]